MDSIINKISETVKTTSHIDTALFKQYNVKRGLRNEDHTGVLVGLSKVGDVLGYERNEDGSLKPVPGRLLYRGVSIEDIVRGVQKDKRLGFEETIFLILAGYLPKKEELDEFSLFLNKTMDLNKKVKMHMLDLEGQDVMNILARCVLEMYTFDKKPNETSPENVVRQSLELIAKFPTIIAYAYNIYNHSSKGASLHIRNPQKNMSLAENFLFMIKGRKNYTPLEVRILDLALMLHADHGGGNNSTFAVRVTSSSGTDTYSSIAAGIGSLKGPLHGGANLRVVDMLKNIKANVKNWDSVDEVDDYLKKILNKEAYNKTGLIYGIGHAVYTISDPRAVLLKEMARELAIEKGREKEFNFYMLIEERAIKNFMEFKGLSVNKQVCCNVDFYSGFVYDMISLPKEIYTPLFAMARIVGWCAHRIEELNFENKRIIRPAYKNAGDVKDFVDLDKR